MADENTFDPSWLPPDSQSWAGLGQLIQPQEAFQPPPIAIRPMEGGLAQITLNSGARFTVSQEHAEGFQGFLNELESRGYKVDPGQSGGYNYRNIAGTNTLSNHARGAAVDVNWTDNPKGTVGKIPPDLARELAAKYGLTWGGDWSNPDPMHFEFGSARRPAPPVQNRSLVAFAGNQLPNHTEAPTQAPASAPTRQSASSSSPPQSAPPQRRSQVNVLDAYLSNPSSAPQQAPAPESGRMPNQTVADPQDGAKGPMPSADNPILNGQGATWQERLRTPEARAFLISTGLQLMTGGWGNGLQQLGVAMGKGAVAMSETEAARIEQENKTADRDSREKMTREQIAGREQVSAARNETNLLRAAMMGGAKNAYEHKLWQSDVSEYMKNARSNVANVGRNEQDMLAEANEYARQQMERRRQQGGGEQPNAASTPTGVVTLRPPVTPTQGPVPMRDRPHQFPDIPQWLRNMFPGGDPPTGGVPQGIP